MTATDGTETPNALTKGERESMLMGVEKMVKKEVVRAKIPTRHREDVEQECNLLLWKQTERFDPARGVKWSTYACACLKRMLANWKVTNNCEDMGRLVFETEFPEELADPRSERVQQTDDEDGIDGDTMGRLANAVRRTLASGVLEKLGAGHRRLVELVAFDGLTAEQIADQDGHPVKVVRCNLKAALRRLCALGHTSHAVTDAEVATATAPQHPVADRERDRKRARESNRVRTNAELVADLEAAAGDETFAVDLSRLDADMRVIVAAIIDRSFTVDEAVELMGGKRKAVVQRLKNVARRVAKGQGTAVQAEVETVAP